MNCKTFALDITDANQNPHEDFAEHLAECDACADEFAARRELAKSLQALRETTAATHPPARLEAALRENFRRDIVPASGAAVTNLAHATNVVSLVSKSKSDVERTSLTDSRTAFGLSGDWRRHAPLAASIIVSVMVVAAASYLRPMTDDATLDSPPRPGASTSRTGDIASVPPASSDTSIASDPRILASQLDVSNATTNRLLARAADSATTDNSAEVSDAAYTSKPRERRPHGRTNDTRPNVRFAASSTGTTTRDSSVDAELTTDFLPLVESDQLAQMESGHVVRVTLPRHALVALGLPMNLDRANEPVKADVLIGDDGTARAIRFVR